MDDALDRAVRRREKLLRELEKLDEYIRLHRELFGDEDTSLSASPHQPREPIQSEEPPAASQRTRGRPAEIAAAAERVIRELNRPVQRGELVERIEAEGIGIHSEDKARYIGTILWREKDRFENIEGEGYWLVGVDRPDSTSAHSLFE